MKRQSLFSAVPVVACAVPSLLFALGADHKGLVGGGDKWPKGLTDLANRRDRVHGYFVNREDIFFYSGNTKAFNDFLVGYSKLENTVLQLVIRPGPKRPRSPWDKVDREIHVDWSLYTSPFARKHPKAPRSADKFITRIDLFPGRMLDWRDSKFQPMLRCDPAGNWSSLSPRTRRSRPAHRRRSSP